MKRNLNSRRYISTQKILSKSSKFGMKEFILNKFIKLKLEDDKTIIYVNNERFNQCKFLLINIPIEEITSLEDIESIDDVAERLDRSLEHEEDKLYTVPPEIEFWGHCSNLHVWYENNYNTKLIHRSLAFPLLKRLTEVGDKFAERIFKEEIAMRFEEGNESVKEYLRKEGFLKYLDNEQFYSLLFGIKFDSLDDLIRVIGSYSIIDRMSTTEFLEFIDSLDNKKLRDLVKNPKKSNQMNFLQAILEDLGDYKKKRFGKNIFDNIFKKIGAEYYDYLMKLLIDEDGYINLPVLESIVQIDSEKVKDFLNNTQHRFKFGFRIDRLWEFQQILNPLLVCFNPEELMIFLEENHKNDFLEIVFPKMRRFRFLNMSKKNQLDMKDYITAFLLDEEGGDFYIENLSILGEFLADTILSELVDRHGEIDENIKEVLQWIGGEAEVKLDAKLDTLSEENDIEEYYY